MSRSPFPRVRARAVWFALATGTAAVVAIALAVLAPVIALITGAAGAAGFVRVPFGTITIVVAAGFLLAAGLLALILRSRRGPAAWILAVAAVIAALVVSVYPVVAVAIAASGQASEIVPFISDLIAGR